MALKRKNNVFVQICIPLLAEFTAQFIHTLWGVMASGPDTPPKNANATSDDLSDGISYFQAVFMPALQSGLSVWMQIVLFWKISVAHFNPAISMGFLVTGHLKPIMFVPYVLAQCLGSIAAAFIAKAILGADPSVVVIPDNASSGIVFLNETFMTGILIFYAVAMVMDESYDQATGPMAIGLTVFQGILSAQWVGVACISPSRAFGPVVVTGGSAWNRHWLLWLSDLTGAAVAASYYMLFFAPQDKCWLNAFKEKYSKGQAKRDRAQDTVLVGGEDEVKI